MKQHAHLFGPVNSRRLGRSLGVDMVPFKTCNCNCVYCECGGVPPVPPVRAEYVSATELTGELEQFLGGNPPLDFVTFAGSGEPTLNSALGTVLRFVKDRFPVYKTALLTNGTLLYQKDLQNELLPFDMVLPSLDAVSTEVFHRINRPHCSLDVQQMIDGIAAFSKVFSGQLWIEVFIVPGINDTPRELALFRQELLRIQPSRVQLNSLDRPGACDWVTTADGQSLHAIADLFKPLPVEIISRQAIRTAPAVIHPENLDGTIMHQLQRRPATLEEIAVMCGVTINVIGPAIDRLAAQQLLTAASVDGRIFYRISGNP
jgi:wyosine [tRNA(Phe)-imidazoG37] synthetase (radical SAM superfamily)